MFKFILQCKWENMNIDRFKGVIFPQTLTKITHRQIEFFGYLYQEDGSEYNIGGQKI